MKNLTIMLTLIFILTGCADMLGRVNTVSYAELNNASSPKTKDCEIEIFRSKKPEKAFTELGIVSVGSRYPHNCKYSDQLISAKKQACSVGGDALYDIREATSGLCTAVTATVIRWD